MSEDANQQDTIETNEINNADESSPHLEESVSDEREMALDDQEQNVSAESVADLSSDDFEEDSVEASASPAESDFEQTGEDDPEALNQLAYEVEALRSQLDERTSQYMRIAADFENFRKRTAREKTELEQRVKRDTLSELLPVIDSFDRARSHIKPQTDQEENIHNSYQGVYKQLVDCLKRIGVAPMRSKGQPFDPNLHEAVMREPTNEFDEGMVVEELVSGYLLGEQVLRHAMVKVAAPLEPESVSEGDEIEEAENAVSD